MQITHSKLYRFVARCREIGASAIILTFFANVQMAQAADGDLDPLFGSGGMVMTDIGKSTDLAEAVAIQADGKLVVVGTTYKNNDFSNEDFVVTRYNTDGTLDITFGNQGKVRTDFPGLAAVPSSVVIQPDGKIVVAGGAFPLFTFLGDFKVVRYNPNGSLDQSFGDGGIVTTIFPAGSYAFDVALQSDGKIIAAGTFFVDFDPGESSDTDFALARYNPDGTPDATFGNGGQVTTDFVGFEDDAFSVLIQPDGKIVAVGSANNPATFYDFAAARYLSNGTIDTTFGVAGKVSTDFGVVSIGRARPPFNPMARSSRLDLKPMTEACRISVSRAIPQTVFSTPPIVATGKPKSTSALAARVPPKSWAKRRQNHCRRRCERRVLRRTTSSWRV